MVELVSKWNKATSILSSRLGRPPFKREIAKELNLSREGVDAIIRAISTAKMTTQSLSHEEARSMSEAIEDSNTLTPDDEVLNDQEILKISELLEIINERDAKILKMRFGIDCDKPMTLKEISEIVGLTRERVRQIQNEALKELYVFMNKERPSEIHELVKSKQARRRRRNKKKRTEK
jgi:RNA polymerase primary sigma factor